MENCTFSWSYFVLMVLNELGEADATLNEEWISRELRVPLSEVQEALRYLKSAGKAEQDSYGDWYRTVPSVDEDTFSDLLKRALHDVKRAGDTQVGLDELESSFRPHRPSVREVLEACIMRLLPRERDRSGVAVHTEDLMHALSHDFTNLSEDALYIVLLDLMRHRKVGWGQSCGWFKIV
ncbi:MAG: hypothetical protein KatS3mg022_3676 [Armatimonadota bacterium]|nr:MAG: hypothetical protein KatS3mg022_3676 [Armatimonadota bacterium]